MSFFSILETFLVGPLKLVFEIIYDIGYRFLRDPGLAIVFLSFAVNILVLPLYRRADAMQEAARDTEAKLHDGVAHIKKTFSGDERMMILQTYYRQNHYKPTDALRGSVSLLMQIPFFIAAYQFLSGLEIFRGFSFGPIADLSAPDGLLVIGGISINLLPILMTLINVVSSVLYLRGFPLKTKVQLYGMALFFLVFLYASPSCLVFYWTLNNVFSLLKTIFYKLKDPQKTLRILCTGLGAVLLGFGALIYHPDSLKRKVFVIIVGAVLLTPALFLTLKRSALFQKTESQPNQKIFLLGTVFLSALTGVLIPSAIIADSPEDFVDITYFYHPLWYVVGASCLAIGTFLIWMRVFYWLADPKGKRFFEYFAWILCGVALVDYMFFGTNLGVISPALQIKGWLPFSTRQKAVNLLILTVIAVVLYLCVRKWRHAAENVLIVSIAALSVMSAWNLVTIKTSVDKIPLQQGSESEDPHFRLSTTGENVVVIVLDSAMGEYIPYIFNEKPELKEKFEGFTHYGNTVSFGGHTMFTVSALLGGYEYTPVELNKRSGDSILYKRNEAAKVLPTIFSESGYEVTICDHPYVNYGDVPGAAMCIATGWFEPLAQKLESIEHNHRNFFCFSIMKSMPLFLQNVFYDYGQFCQPNFSAIQVRNGLSASSGMDNDFMKNYRVLLNLSNMTQVTAATVDTFLVLYNNTTHDPMLLQEPDYTPAQHVNNTVYDAEHTDRFLIDDRELKMETGHHATYYHANMAAMIQLGNWFDYLRENGVYDNTRIILAADHGTDNISQMDELIMGSGAQDVEGLYPLLMVKDFGSEGFDTSDEFMTNADVPTLAMQDIIRDPVNPFTGNPISDGEKTAHDQFIIISENVPLNDGTYTFPPTKWGGVRDNIWDKDNWTFCDEEIVLDEHSMP